MRAKEENDQLFQKLMKLKTNKMNNKFLIKLLREIEYYRFNNYLFSNWKHLQFVLCPQLILAILCLMFGEDYLQLA